MDEHLTEADAEHQKPVTLLEELRIEAALVPNRRGQLYALAAAEIERLNHALVEAVDVCMRKANIRPRPGLSERTASYCNQRAAECADAVRQVANVELTGSGAATVEDGKAAVPLSGSAQG